MVKGKAGGFTLKGGDAQTGPLTTLFDGGRPKGYDPMKKQGSIILGIGGDNSNRAVGTFYEGVMTSGYSTDAADAEVHANIVVASAHDVNCYHWLPLLARCPQMILTSRVQRECYKSIAFDMC